MGGILAHEFARRGHEVIVVTRTMGEGRFSFEVRRGPRLAELPGLTRWSDVVFHNNISMRTAWPLAWIRRPWVVAHHTWIARMDGTLATADRAKLLAIRRATNVAVSGAIAAKLPVKARVIPNPYRDDLFHRTNIGNRDGDLIFLGRLVSDKGVDLLLEAMGMMTGKRPRVTIVGEGPEKAALEAQARRLGIEATFAGWQRGSELVEMLNGHRMLVVPSVWEEPFGVVALEAMACGCVPVVASSGGLPEAVEEAGVTFTKGDARGLAECLTELMGDERRIEELRGRAPGHLEKHRAGVVAEQYLEVLEGARR